jgi:hypothetical protein
MTRHCQSTYKIIAGGQSGAEQAGLDFANEAGLQAGGWCLKSRMSDLGFIPDRYPLVPAALTADEWAKLNVERSNGTLVIYKPPLKSRIAKAVNFARALNKYLLLVPVGSDLGLTALAVRRWLEAAKPQILNVTGTREFRHPGTYAYTLLLLRGAFGVSATAVAPPPKVGSIVVTETGAPVLSDTGAPVLAVD